MTEKRAWYDRWPVFIKRGGPTSGHRGHKGRAGIHGGSLPGWASQGVTSSRSLGEGETGINESTVLEFEDGTKGIFKPNDELMNYGSVKSELMASRLDEELGWGIVPDTVSYAHEGKSGSLQKWVDDSSTAEQNGVYIENQWEATTGRMAMFDCLTDNVDRHEGNILYGPTQVWAIDNGGAFGTRAAGVGKYGTFAMRPNQYNIKRRSPTLEERAATVELANWRGSERHRAFTGELGETFSEDHVKVFNRNLDTLIEWGGKE